VRGGWDDDAGMIWIAMLCIQALPYSATLAMAIISVLPHTMPAPKQSAEVEDEAAPALQRAA
jgi:hypothetical protein